jgi:hypothetical protein
MTAMLRKLGANGKQEAILVNQSGAAVCDMELMDLHAHAASAMTLKGLPPPP